MRRAAIALTVALLGVAAAPPALADDDAPPAEPEITAPAPDEPEIGGRGYGKGL